jgi:hypothetical protein
MGKRDARTLQPLDHLGAGEGGDGGAHLGQDAVARGDAGAVAAQAFIGPQRVEAEKRAEFGPQTVAHHADEQRMVGGFEDVIDRPGRDARGHGRGGRAGHRELRHMLADQIGGGLEQAGDDLLPAAGAVALFQRGENADHAEHGAGHIDHAAAGAQGTPGRAGHIGQATHHLGHLVQRGAILVRAGQKALFAAIDQARVDRRKRLMPQPQAVQRAGAEVLDQNVGAGRQIAGDLQPAGRFEVEADRLLAPVVHREIACARSGQAAGGVAADRLDADHLGAQAREDMARRRAHHHMGEFNDAQTSQSPGRGGRGGVAHRAILS